MTRKTILLTAAVLLFGFNNASADTFTESVQFGAGPTDFSNATGTTAGPGGNQLYYFDSNGGQLTSITFSYSYSVSSEITVTNTSGSSSSGTAQTQSAPQFGSTASSITSTLNSVINNYIDSMDGNSVTIGARTLTPIAADVRSSVATYSLSPGQSASFSSTGNYSKGPFTITDSSVLSAFQQVGGGTFTPVFTTLSGLIRSSSGGNTTANQTVVGQGNLVISYNFTSGRPTPPSSVPEPASMVLVGAGLIGASLLRRRQR